ncbi:MAG: ATP-binding protein, partial [Chthoniobacteraceae bacterium]
REVMVLAEVMATNCAAALAFGDSQTAAEVMAPLHVKPEVENAAVLGEDHKHFARFGENDGCPLPPPGAPAGIIDRGATWTVVQPIVFEGKRIGTFFMDVDYAGPRGVLQRLYLGVTAAVLAGSLLLAVLLTLRLQDFIMRPIRLLAGASEAVARDHDYSLRVASAGADELGQLTGAFNHMLGRIQTQDSALHEARGQLQIKVLLLEKEIGERQQAEEAVRVAELKFRGLVEQLPAITYHASLGESCTWSYVSPQILPLLGFTPEEWLASDRLWFEHIHPEDLPIPLAAETVAILTGKFLAEYRMFTRGGELRWFRDQALLVPGTETGNYALYGVLTDITEAKAAETHLAELNKRLVDASRQAGMAEVATGVLHNVGNVLNSVNTSVGVVTEKLRRSKVPNLPKAAALLTGKNGNLAKFLTEDAQGQKLPGYLAKLGEHLVAENAVLLTETALLGRNIEHIKEIVAMQQSYAKVSGVFEVLPIDHLVEDALAMNSGAFERHGVAVERRFSPVAPARVDRHKVLQILINLLRNAKYALDDVEGPDKRITISIGETDEQVRVVIADNGVGIPPENLDRIFGHGFTTRKSGHGFGLHSGANAAKEMGGSLTVASAGPGCGATFTLTLPAAPTSHHA